MHIVHVGCMAHLRRYVVEAIEGGGEDVAALIQDIGALYRIETEAREQQLGPQQRAQLRVQRCLPIFERLNARFTRIRGEVLPQSPLGKASGYALGNWSKLTCYADPDFGHVLIDNNSIERGDLPAFYGPISASEMAFSGLVVENRRLNSAGVSWPRLECGRTSLN